MIENGGIQFFNTGNRTLALVSEWKGLGQELIRIPVDILIVSNQTVRDLEDIITHFEFSTMVIDGSVYRNDAEHAIEELKGASFEYHVVPVEGAYVEEL